MRLATAYTAAPTGTPSGSETGTSHLMNCELRARIFSGSLDRFLSSRHCTPRNTCNLCALCQSALAHNHKLRQSCRTLVRHNN